MAISSIRFGAFNANITRDFSAINERKEATAKRAQLLVPAIKTRPIAKAPPVIQPPILEKPILRLPPEGEGSIAKGDPYPNRITPNTPPVLQQIPGLRTSIDETAAFLGVPVKPLVQLPAEPVGRLNPTFSNNPTPFPSNAQEKLQAVFEKLAGRFDIASRAYQVAALPKQFEQPISLPPVNEVA